MTMEKTNAPSLAARMDAPWDLRDVPLDHLGETAEAKQLVDGVLARVAEPGLEVVVAGFNAAV
jgi:hypothetical protein